MNSNTDTVIAILPVEIWRKILYFIERKYVKAFLNLRLTCHVFREIVKPIFYQALQFHIRLPSSPLPSGSGTFKTEYRSSNEIAALWRKDLSFLNFMGSKSAMKAAQTYTRRLHLNLSVSTLGLKPDLTRLFWLLENCTGLIELVIQDTKGILLSLNDYCSMTSILRAKLKNLSIVRILSCTANPCLAYYQWIRLILSIPSLIDLSIPYLPPDNDPFIPLAQLLIQADHEGVPGKKGSSSGSSGLLAIPERWAAQWNRTRLARLTIEHTSMPIIRELAVLGDPCRLRHLSVPIGMGFSDLSLLPFKNRILSLKILVEERASTALADRIFTHLDLRLWTALKVLCIEKKKSTVPLGVVWTPAITKWALPMKRKNCDLAIRFKTEDHFFACDFIVRAFILDVPHLAGTVKILDYDLAVRFTKKTMDDRFLHCKRPVTENDASDIILAYEDIIWEMHNFQGEAGQTNISFHPKNFLEELRQATELELQTFRLWRNQKFPIISPPPDEKYLQSQHIEDDCEDEEGVHWNPSDLEDDSDVDQDANGSDSEDAEA